MARRKWMQNQWFIRLGTLALMIIVMTSTLAVGGIINSGNIVTAIVWLFYGWIIYFLIILSLALALAFHKHSKRR